MAIILSVGLSIALSTVLAFLLEALTRGAFAFLDEATKWMAELFPEPMQPIMTQVIRAWPGIVATVYGITARPVTFQDKAFYYWGHAMGIWSAYVVVVLFVVALVVAVAAREPSQQDSTFEDAEEKAYRKLVAKHPVQDQDDENDARLFARLEATLRVKGLALQAKSEQIDGHRPATIAKAARNMAVHGGSLHANVMNLTDC